MCNLRQQAPVRAHGLFVDMSKQSDALADLCTNGEPSKSRLNAMYPFMATAWSNGTIERPITTMPICHSNIVYKTFIHLFIYLYT